MAKRLVYAEDVKTEIDNWLECVGYATIGKGLSYYGELLGCIADAPTVDVVHRETLAQVMWERDVAMKQLEEHGIPFGCKADVQAVVHGEWIFNRGRAYGEPLYFCSVCTDGGSEWGTDKYCPNCGAKMDGKVSE